MDGRKHARREVLQWLNREGSDGYQDRKESLAVHGLGFRVLRVGA